LDQLHKGQVGFPPDRNRFSSFRIPGVHANEVVGVHDSVDESIEDNGQVDITIVEDVCVEPVEQKDGSVVVHVEEGKLSPLLSQDNKDSIPEIPNLGDIKQPQQIGNRRIIFAVWNAWSESVSIAVGQKHGFDCHVCTQHDLRDIVEELDWVRVHGRHIFHNPRTDYDKQNVCECNAECRCEICQPPTL